MRIDDGAAINEPAHDEPVTAGKKLHLLLFRNPRLRGDAIGEFRHKLSPDRAQGVVVIHKCINVSPDEGDANVMSNARRQDARSIALIASTPGGSSGVIRQIFTGAALFWRMA
jgi:hypothetical protein